MRDGLRDIVGKKVYGLQDTTTMPGTGQGSGINRRNFLGALAAGSMASGCGVTSADTKLRVLNAGDSHAKNYAPFLEAEFGPGVDVTSIAVAGAATDYIAELLRGETEAGRYYDLCILEGGVNDLFKYARGLQGLWSGMTDAALSARICAPVVAYLDIMPNLGESGAQITAAANDMVFGVCSRLGFVRIRANEFLTPRGPDIYISDAIHYTQETYADLAKFVRGEVAPYV